jgi:hypothetical protein
MTLAIVLVLVALDVWTILRVNELRRVVFSLIKFNAGLVENLKKDGIFKRDSSVTARSQSEEFALETIYSVWREFTKGPDTRLRK